MSKTGQNYTIKAYNICSWPMLNYLISTKVDKTKIS